MNLIAILAALGLEQWHAFHWRASIERGFVLFARRLEQRFNGGTRTQGLVALLLALVAPVVIATALWWAADNVHPLLGVLVNIVVLYCLMGFRRFSHAASAIMKALARGDLTAARRRFAGGSPTSSTASDSARGLRESGSDASPQTRSDPSQNDACRISIDANYTPKRARRANSPRLWLVDG